MTSVAQERKRQSRGVKALVVGLVVILAITAIALYEVRQTRPARQAMGSYYKLVVAGNRQDIETARGFCSERFLKTHGLELAPEGGLAGLPRGIDQNYKVWQEGENVWLCPTDRTGPIYQIVEEGGTWKFDGLVGLLRPGGVVVPLSESSQIDEPGAGKPDEATAKAIDSAGSD